MFAGDIFAQAPATFKVSEFTFTRPEKWEWIPTTSSMSVGWIWIGSNSSFLAVLDLNSGQVVWFNRLMRTSGDLREPEPAAETVEALLSAFPASQ